MSMEKCCVSTNHAAMTTKNDVSIQYHERDFASVCESFCFAEDVADEFPLSGRLRLQSRIALGFPSDDFHLEKQKSDDANNGLPVIHISFLALAGASGPLPWWITEKIILDATGDGKALHRFLDLLNRRFWELLFLKDRLGSNPQYGSSNSQHALLLNELSFAFVGLEQTPDLLSGLGGGSVLHKTMQYCWSTSSGSGSHETLAVLLSKACGLAVEVRGFQLARLPVADQAKLVLGAYGRLSSLGSVIGNKALVLGSVELQVVLPGAELLNQYLPSVDGAHLKLLCRSLVIFYGQSLPQVALRLLYFSDNTFAKLGGERCRLSWGGMLSTNLPCSQMVSVSAQAMSSKQQNYERSN